MKKLLIISSTRLGDSILSSGVLSYYKKLYRNISVTIVCGSIPASLFKFCKNVDNVQVIKKKKFSFHWFHIWAQNIFSTWDCIIDLRGTLLSFCLVSKRRSIFWKKKHTFTEHKVISISKLIDGKLLSPSIDINEKLIGKTIFLDKIKRLKKKKLVMISPSANWIGKIWPIDRYISMIRALKKKKLFKDAVFLVVGPIEEKEIIYPLLREKLELFDLVGKTGLPEIFLIMKICDLFIGNDSGLMHLAAAANIPTIGLFGPSNVKVYHPWGKNTLGICSPRSPEELMGSANFDSKSCGSLMKDLQVKNVLKKIMEFSKNNINIK